MSEELSKSSDLISAGPRAALPAISAEQMVLALDKYRELQTALDRAMPEQIINLDGKPFRKKGYWRAISLAFNLKVEKTEERRELSGKFMDGRDNFGWVVTYRATHPSGRDMTGDGACFAVEKARRFKCPHLESEGSKRTKHFPHNTCPDFDPDFQWRVLPGDATEHNVRSHANTRAFNRAVSNLVGFGEVSAEEVEREEHSTHEQRASEAKPAGSGRTESAQGSSQSSGSAAAGAPAGGASGQPEGATKVKNVTTKEGSNDRGPWLKYSIYFEDGRQASTFSKTDGEHAESAHKSGASVIPKIKKDGKFFNLEGFVPWPKKEAERRDDHPNPHQDEPLNGPEKILTIRETKTETRTIWFIQTEKRVLITDKAQHVEDANEARKEGMGLTPRIEVIEGKNRLLGWEETVAMHAAAAAENDGAGPEAEEDKASEEQPAEEKKSAPRRRKAAEK